jgi:hypothetical protein
MAMLAPFVQMRHSGAHMKRNCYMRSSVPPAYLVSSAQLSFILLLVSAGQRGEASEPANSDAFADLRGTLETEVLHLHVF